eukprot:GEMP01085719.1.p1 GENE.GEMP01085719.1~~GEMP01085719.1.p1  ORF type:complete len:254 (+),score=55.67 GEMP01085719.1:134-895(+)
MFATAFRVLLIYRVSTQSVDDPHSLTGRTQFEAFKDAVQNNIIPDKSNDQWTITAKFKADLLVLFGPTHNDAGNWTVLEIGSYLGYTTAILAQRFKHVVAVDMLDSVLQANKVFNARRTNIDYIQMDTIGDDWAPLDKYEFDVAMIDAGHGLAYVTWDIWHVLQLKPRPKMLIFDDYSIEPGVKESVDAFVEANAIRCEVALGEGEGWTLPDGRALPGPEGVFCSTNEPSAYDVARLRVHFLRAHALSAQPER